MDFIRKVNIKSVVFYSAIFLIFLIWNLLLVPVNLDEIWNYGFAHNIYNGLIPYKDFNMVLTPLFPFLMSLPFFIFGSSMLVFHIFNVLMLTVLMYFLKKMYGDRSLVFLIFLFLPLPVSFPNYNVFLFFLLVVIVYCEKNKVNDYVIGVLLALVCLTKQSVGVCMLLPSLFYLRDFKKIFKRFIGFLIPCFIFLFYLIFNDCVYEFFDLCLFGLFDFAAGNGKGFNIYWALFILIIVVTLYFIKKDKQNITNYYALAFYTVLIPLFDTYHFQVMLLGFLMILVDRLKFIEKINLKLFTFGVIIGVSCIALFYRLEDGFVYPNKINHFEYRLLDKYGIEFTEEMSDFIKENKEKNIIYLCSDGYYFKLVNDIDISYLDLINTGNWGYNGSEKLFNSVMSVENAIYVVDESELSEIKQTDKNILKYVLKNGKKIKSIRIYDIYIIE